MRFYIIGDQSRFQYLKMLIGDVAYNELVNVTAINKIEDVHVVCDQDGSNGVVISSEIPLNTEVIIQGTVRQGVEYEGYDKILIFDEFPYRTKDIVEDVRKISDHPHTREYEIILIEGEQKGLKSDVSTIGDAMNEAKKLYAQEGHSVKISSLSKIKELLFQTLDDSYDIYALLRKKLDYVLQYIHEDFNFEYDLAYEDFFDDIYMEKVMSGGIKRGGDIRKIFVGEISKRIVDRGHSKIQMFIEGIYKYFMREINMWDLERDLKEFFVEIQGDFANFIYTNVEELCFQRSEQKYEVFYNQHRENIVRMKNCTRQFFKDELKQKIVERMENRIEKLKELLGK